MALDITKSITSVTYNGNNFPIDTGMNVQMVMEWHNRGSTSYGDIPSETITVAKTGTYTVIWGGYRSGSSGTYGTRYVITHNGTDTTSANYTSFKNTYGYFNSVTGVSLTAGDTIKIQGRSNSSTTYIGVTSFVIQQTA